MNEMAFKGKDLLAALIDALALDYISPPMVATFVPLHILSCATNHKN